MSDVYTTSNLQFTYRLLNEEQNHKIIKLMQSNNVLPNHRIENETQLVKTDNTRRFGVIISATES